MQGLSTLVLAALTAAPATGQSNPVSRFRLPLAFVENAGQWPTDASFVAVTPGLVARADPEGLWLDLRARERDAHEEQRVLLRLTLAGAGSGATLRGERLLPGTHNYFLGRDPAGWRTELSGYAALRWTDLRFGVDLLLREGRDGCALEYALECRPGTGSRLLELRLEGAESLSLTPDGSLVAETRLGPLRQTAPRAWEHLATGGTRDVPAHFTLLGMDRFALEVAGRDESLALTLDPGLEWAGYLGGSAIDLGYDLALSATDEPVTVGKSDSLDFPTTPGVLQGSPPAGRNGFVTKVSPDGSALVYSTYIGGSNLDETRGVTLRASGAAIVVGVTRSPDFPVTPGAFDTSIGGADDAFVLELDPQGTSLRFATFFGGSQAESSRTAVLSPDGAILFVGQTQSPDLPTTPGVLQPALAGSMQWLDGFVARLSEDGSQISWATYLGGDHDDTVNDLRLESSGVVVLGGVTHSPDFPVTPGAFDTSYTSPAQISPCGFVAKIDAQGTQILAATYLGGSHATGVVSVDVNSSGVVAAVGLNNSADFPTTPGAFDTSPHTDGFVTLFQPDLGSLFYSTVFGTDDSTESVGRLVLEESGVVTICGFADHLAPPTTPGAYDASMDGFPDGFVTRFKPDGSGLLYSTLIGGHLGADGVVQLALDAAGRAVLLGSCAVDSFPVTPGSFDTTWGGGPIGQVETFLARLEMQPLGVTSLGMPTQACKGPVRLTALDVPKAGNGHFRVACVGAPPGAIGALAVGSVAPPPGIALLGVTVYLDLSQPYVLVPAVADALGYREFSLPLPLAAAGKTRGVQAVWLDTGGCGGSLTFSASDALQVTVGAP